MLAGVPVGAAPLVELWLGSSLGSLGVLPGMDVLVGVPVGELVERVTGYPCCKSGGPK